MLDRYENDSEHHGSRAKDRLERKDVVRWDNTFLNENKGSDHRFDQNLSFREHNQCCYKIVNRCKKKTELQAKFATIWTWIGVRDTPNGKSGGTSMQVLF